jgi:hypothetical protein
LSLSCAHRVLRPTDRPHPPSNGPYFSQY